MANENGKGGSHTDRVRDLAKYIADQPDEISEVTEQHFHLPKGTTLETDQTGRLRAISHDEITLTDHGIPPKPESVPPKAKFALAVLKELPPHWRGPVVIVALGIAGVLAWRGGAGLGWWP